MKEIQRDLLGRRKRRLFSKEQKRLLVLQFQKEGGKAADFSRKEGLTYSAFLKWIKQVSPEPGALLPVRLSQSCAALPRSVMEVHLENGRSIHLRPGFDAELVAQLVRVLEQAC